MANETSTLVEHFHTTDDPIATELETENFTKGMNGDSQQPIPDEDGWIGFYPPMVWKIPHFENLFVYGLGTCLVFGTFGNVLSFIILLRKKLRQMPTNAYFCSLAVVDTLILWASTQDYWFSKVIGRPLVENIPCHISLYCLYTLLMWSSWLLMFLSGERILVVKIPIKTITWTKPTRWRYVLVTVLPFMCFALSSPSLFFFKDTPRGCLLVESVYTEGLTVSNMFLRNLLPMALILSCNALIIYELIVSSRAQDIGQNVHHAKANRKVTILCLIVSITYMILTLPSSIFVTIVAFEGQFNVSAETWYLILMVVDCLFCVNHSINFLLYMVASPTFRKEALMLIQISKNTSGNIPLQNPRHDQPTPNTGAVRTISKDVAETRT